MKKIVIYVLSIILGILIASAFEGCKKEDKFMITPSISASSISDVEGYWERCVSSPTGSECYQKKWEDGIIYEPLIAGDTSAWGLSGEYYSFNSTTDSLFISDSTDISSPVRYKVIRADSSLWITTGTDTIRYHRL